MKIWGLNALQLEAALYKANEAFGDNIVFKRHPEKSGRAYRTTITVWRSDMPGSRRTLRQNYGGSIQMLTTRKVAAACWHAHRAFMEQIFLINPSARIQTALADYKGLEDFLASFEHTGMENIGSIAMPLQMRHACNCKGCVGAEE